MEDRETNDIKENGRKKAAIGYAGQLLQSAVGIKIRLNQRPERFHSISRV